MLRQSLTSLLIATCLLTTLALAASPAPSAQASPARVQGLEGPQPDTGLLPRLAAWLDDLFGYTAVSAASCNADDPCAEDACNPEFCTCNSDPCAEDACNPDACDGDPGGGGTPGLDPTG